MTTAYDRCVAASVLVFAVGCSGPMGLGLDQGEVDIAAEGQYDERSQDETLGDVKADSFTADGATAPNGLAGDPFLLSQQRELGSTRLNVADSPGTQAILVPGPEPNLGGSPANAGTQLPPG